MAISMLKRIGFIIRWYAHLLAIGVPVCRTSEVVQLYDNNILFLTPCQSAFPLYPIYIITSHIEEVLTKFR
jgi:hypothetical protein